MADKYLNLAGLSRFKDKLQTEVIDRIDEEISSVVGDFSSALMFKQFISSSATIDKNYFPSGDKPKKGWVMVCNVNNITVTFLDANGTQQTAVPLEMGDTLVCLNEEGAASGAWSRWGILQTNWSITLPSSTPELNTTNDVTLATVGGKDIKVKIGNALATIAQKGYADAVGSMGAWFTEQGSGVVTEKATKQAIDAASVSAKNGALGTSISADGSAVRGIDVNLGGTVGSPTVEIVVTKGTIDSAAATNTDKVVVGSDVWSAISTTTTSLRAYTDTAAAGIKGSNVTTGSGSNAGVTVSVGGTVIAPNVGVTVTKGSVGSQGASTLNLVDGTTVYTAVESAKTAAQTSAVATAMANSVTAGTGSNAGVSVTVGGTVGSKAVTVAITKGVVGSAVSGNTNLVDGTTVFTAINNLAPTQAITNSEIDALFS